MELVKPRNPIEPNVPAPVQNLPPLPPTPLPPISTQVPLPPPPRRNPLKSILIFSTSLILVLGTATFLAWKTDYLDRYLPTSVKGLLGKSSGNGMPNVDSGEGQPSQLVAEEVLSAIKQKFIYGGFNPRGPEAGVMWWSDGVDERYILNNFARVLTVDLEVSEAESIQYRDKSFEHPKIQRLYEITNDYFTTEAYSKNLRNSLSPQGEQTYLNYVLAFEKGNLKCTATTYSGTTTGNYGSPQEKEFISFELACEDSFARAKKEQLPYLVGLKIDQIENQVGIIVNKEIGDFFAITVVGRTSVSGYGVIGKWEGDKLVKIFEGQDIPPCSDMENYAVPQEIYRECY